MPIRDLGRKEQSEACARLAVHLRDSIEDTKVRLAEWKLRTGKSQAAYYRFLSIGKRESK